MPFESSCHSLDGDGAYSLLTVVLMREGKKGSNGGVKQEVEIKDMD